MEQQKINELVQNIIMQAKYFLKEAGEFFPYGAIMTPENTVNTLGIYMNEDYPKSVDVINRLHQALITGISEGKYVCGCIGVDAIIKSNGMDDANEDALEIRCYDKSLEIRKIYYRYYKDGSDYVFELYEHSK